MLETIIQGSAIVNPKEMAHHILEQVLAWTGREPADDMTVIVVGMWEICDRNTLQARMRRTVNGTLLVAPADVTILLAENPDGFDPKKYGAAGMENVTALVKEKISVCGSEGQA